MEFWGVEVKPGETIKCEPGDGKFLHLSQASLGEIKKEKGSESVTVYVKFDDQKLVIGNLSAESCPQIQYDLVFEKEFELSHNWKKGSIFFVGYKTVLDEGPQEFSEEESESEEEEEEEVPVKKDANGKAEVAAVTAKAKASTPKADQPVVKAVRKLEEEKKPKEDAGKDADSSNDDEDEDDSDDDDEGSDDESDDDDDMLEGEDDDSSNDEDEDESSDDEDEATPTPKAEIGKKRSVPESESKNATPAPEKKAKLMSPPGSQKTGGEGKKKGGHVATPHPAKQGGKTPQTNNNSFDRSKQSFSPKSGGGSNPRFNNSGGSNQRFNKSGGGRGGGGRGSGGRGGGGRNFNKRGGR